MGWQFESLGYLSLLLCSSPFPFLCFSFCLSSSLFLSHSISITPPLPRNKHICYLSLSFFLSDPCAISVCSTLFLFAAAAALLLVSRSASVLLELCCSFVGVLLQFCWSSVLVLLGLC